MIRRYEGYDPSSIEEKIITFASEKDARKRAVSALCELRGEQQVEVKNGVTKVLKSGCAIRPAEDIHAVPIINRRNGELRHLDLGVEYRNGGNNAGAETLMRSMFEGVWRFATPEEQAAGLQKHAAAKAAVKKEMDRAIEAPAERIGAVIGDKLTQFAETLSKKKS